MDEAISIAGAHLKCSSDEHKSSKIRGPLIHSSFYEMS